MKEPSDKERLEGSEFAVGSPKTAWKFMAVAYFIAFGVVHLASGGAIPLIYLVAFVPAIVLLASGKARQWFIYKNDALTLRSQGKLVDLPISDLRVKSGSDLQILDQPEIEFSSMTTRTVSKLLGSSHMLTPEAVILLAELQKRGAAIDVLGYGSFTGRLEQGKLPAEVRFPFMELYLFACGFFLFIFYLGVQSNDRLEPAVLDLLFPIILFGFLIWGGLYWLTRAADNKPKTRNLSLSTKHQRR